MATAELAAGGVRVPLGKRDNRSQLVLTPPHLGAHTDHLSLNNRACPSPSCLAGHQGPDLQTDFRNNTLLGQAGLRAASAGQGRGRSAGGSAPPWSSLHSGTGQGIGWGRECICYTKTRCCLVSLHRVTSTTASSPSHNLQQAQGLTHTHWVQGAPPRGCRQPVRGPHLLSSICCSRSSFSAGSSEATCSSHTFRSSLEG